MAIILNGVPIPNPSDQRLRARRRSGVGALELRVLWTTNWTPGSCLGAPLLSDRSCAYWRSARAATGAVCKSRCHGATTFRSAVVGGSVSARISSASSSSPRPSNTATHGLPSRHDGKRIADAPSSKRSPAIACVTTRRLVVISCRSRCRMFCYVDRAEAVAKIIEAVAPLADLRRDEADRISAVADSPIHTLPRSVAHVWKLANWRAARMTAVNCAGDSAARSISIGA